MAQQKIVIGIVAGEASGDLLGHHLMEALQQVRPDVEFIGIGGPQDAIGRLTGVVPNGKTGGDGLR